MRDTTPAVTEMVSPPMGYLRWQGFRQNALQGAVKRQNALPGAVKRQNATPGVVKRQNATPGAVKRQNATPGAVKQQNATPGAVKRQGQTRCPVYMRCRQLGHIDYKQVHGGMMADITNT